MALNIILLLFTRIYKFITAAPSKHIKLASYSEKNVKAVFYKEVFELFYVF